MLAKVPRTPRAGPPAPGTPSLYGMARRKSWIPASLFVLLLLAACGNTGQPPELGTRVVTLPGGRKIRVEVMIRQEDMARGMMYRDKLEPDRGMLFLHAYPGLYPYWMHNVRIPLDIIWLDSNRRVTEIVTAEPCLKPAAECPNYGGRRPSQYVLELAGGMAEKYGLEVGSQIDF
jgi:uncharacterized protein